MKNIRQRDILNMFPAALYRQGLLHVQQEQVTDLLYDLNHHVWTANVDGDSMYFVEVNVSNIQQGSIRAYCDCPAYDTHTACSHIVAVLISIANKVSEDEELVADSETTDRLLEAISASYTRDSTFLEKMPLQVIYELKWTDHGYLSLELKVGPKRAYVVQNLPLFLQNVLDHQPHYFTKLFTYHPDSHVFLQQDLEIFELLATVLRNEKVYQELIYPFPKFKEAKRAIIIPPLLIREFLPKLAERDVIFEVDGHEFNDIRIVHDTLPFEFSFETHDQTDFMLRIDHYDGQYLDLYELYFANGTFYLPKKDQLQVLNLLSSLGDNIRQLPVTAQQADQFISEAIPLLNKLGDVEISDEVTKRMIDKPLQATLSLDISDGRVIGKLAYHYGTFVIDPFFDSSDHNMVIMRDSKQEHRIMNLIEEASFRYNGEYLYIDAHEDELYHFLFNMLPLLKEHVEVLSTPAFNRLLSDEQDVMTEIRVQPTTSLLEIDFSIDGMSEHEIQQIIQAIMDNKRYYRLENGSFLSLEGDEFASIKQLVHELQVSRLDLEGKQFTVPTYRGLQIDELNSAHIKYDQTFRQLLAELTSPEEQIYEVPKNFQGTLRDYQKKGYQWFKSLSAYQLGGILADDMGLGKTIQTIAFLLSEKRKRPHLVVVPSAVVYNWKNEFDKFAPDLSVEIMTGLPDERKEQIRNKQDKDVWITSYGTLRQDIDLYQDIHFDTLILDEAQFIKNYMTKSSQAVRQIHARCRFALSGTPIENSLIELWAIFQAVLPGLLPSQKVFNQLPHEKIVKLTKPFILRRVKEDVLTELPEKIESVYLTELTTEQKLIYLGYLRHIQQEATEAIHQDGFHQSRMKILAGLTRLRQICCHPSLFMDSYDGKSGKLEELLDLIHQSIEQGKRLLVFSQFTSMHDLIRKELAAVEIDYFYLHGQTPARERLAMAERFNQGEKQVFLISLRAGGTGLNLTGADTVILYDLWWNPAVEDQAAGRAHRFGQDKVVQVIRMITEGTIEEKIYELQQKKRELIDKIIQPGETMLTSLTEKEIREILSI